jgi:amidase
MPSYNPSQQVEKSLCLQVAATEGILARSVRDVRLGFAALERLDYRDPWQVPPPAQSEELRAPCGVALFTGEDELGTHPEIVALLRKAASWLEDAGYTVEEAAPPRLAEMAELWMAMLYAECFGPVRETMFGLGDDAFRKSFVDTAANLPELDFLGFHAAWARRLGIQREWAEFFAIHPVLLMPTSAQPTFPIDHDQRGKDTLAAILRAFTPLSSTAGLCLPAMSVPIGTAAGAPAGVQLVAGRFMDERCLAAAEALEHRIGLLKVIDPVGA